MTERARSRLAALAWTSLGITACLSAVALVLAANPPSGMAGLGVTTVVFGSEFLALAAVGALIAARRPSHPVGWLLTALGAASSAAGVLAGWSRYFYADQPDVGAVLYVTSNELFKVVYVLLGVVLVLFPTGRPPSQRWRWLIAALLLLLTVGAATDLLHSGPVSDYLVARPPANPLGLPIMAGPAKFLNRFGFPTLAVLLLAAAGSVLLRFRRGDPEQRLQLKWFTLAAGLWAVSAVLDGSSRALTNGGDWQTLPFAVLYFLGTLSMAVAIGIAILRHRLFDVDLVISRTVAYGILAGLITLFYIALVAGVGSLFAAGSQSRLLLAVIATAAVAAAFQPIRFRLQRLANRLVYGARAGPYEVLAQFTAGLDASSQTPDLLPTMARLLGSGTRSDGACVWLPEAAVEVPAACWPNDQVAAAPATRSVPVTHGGEHLGRLAVYRRSRQPLQPTEERLMDGLALHAGLVLKNTGLEQELHQRLRELQASRQRLVATQDEERRRLERDLHDGAQQDLVSLRMKLGLVTSLTPSDPKSVVPLLDEMQEDLGRALDGLRNLARGVYPPLLEAEGLRPALTARARQAPLRTEVHCSAERFPRDIEGAVYFCCSEALQNVTKHASASCASIRVWRTDGEVHFEVRDDGQGLPSEHRAGAGLRHMRDRTEALGGRLVVRSVPGSGVAVDGALPISEAPR